MKQCTNALRICARGTVQSTESDSEAAYIDYWSNRTCSRADRQQTSGVACWQHRACMCKRQHAAVF